MRGEAPPFAALLKRYRRAAGLTHEALAERAGLSARAISDLERGVSRAPRPETVRLLAAALGLAPADGTALRAAARPTAAAPDHPSPAGGAHNLPAQLTSFVGREREVAELRGFLESSTTDVSGGAPRLVTLTGTGGCGKTRLALEVAGGLVGAAGTPDGVWLCELAPLADPALVPLAVLAAAGGREAPGQPAVETLVGSLGPRRLLLVLDNCEHLADASAALVERLLRECPGVLVLATSRELLGVPGERAWRVPSLALPGLHESPAPERLAAYAAPALLVERARLAQPEFAVTSENAPAILAICRRLDGIPLALELAAARLRVLSPEQILARLDDRFRLLTGGTRTGLRRQQTLRATVDWSYALLSDAERAVLRRLAVFSGGCTLPAAESVCAGQGVTEAAVLDLVAALADKSLLVVEGPTDERRYRLLETLRQYAAEKLVDAGEAAATRSRHRDWYVAFAERAAPELVRPHQAHWYRRLGDDLDNLRAALEWCQTDTDGAPAELRLAAALGRLWHVHGHGSEGRAWLYHALARPPESPTTESAVVRATALNWVGRMEGADGNIPAARRLLAQSVATAHASDAPALAALALRHLAMSCSLTGEGAAAQAYLEEALASARAAGDAREAAFALAQLAELAQSRGDAATAGRLAEEALAANQDTGDAGPLCVATDVLALIALAEGDLARARALYEQELAAARGIGFVAGVLFGLRGLGDVARREGDLATARTHFRGAVALARDAGDAIPLTAALARWASVQTQLGSARPAARLYGALARWRVERGGLDGYDGLRRADDDERGLTAARASLSAEEFAAAWAEGQALTLEGAAAAVSTNSEDGGEPSHGAPESVANGSPHAAPTEGSTSGTGGPAPKLR